MSLDDLQAQLDKLVAWRLANLDKVGGPEFQKNTVAHRLLTDLIERGGGTLEERAAVIRKLNAPDD